MYHNTFQITNEKDNKNILLRKMILNSRKINIELSVSIYIFSDDSNRLTVDSVKV